MVVYGRVMVGYGCTRAAREPPATGPAQHEERKAPGRGVGERDAPGPHIGSLPEGRGAGGQGEGEQWPPQDSKPVWGGLGEPR